MDSFIFEGGRQRLQQPCNYAPAVVISDLNCIACHTKVEEFNWLYRAISLKSHESKLSALPPPFWLSTIPVTNPIKYKSPRSATCAHKDQAAQRGLLQPSKMRMKNNAYLERHEADHDLSSKGFAKNPIIGARISARRRHRTPSYYP